LISNNEWCYCFQRQQGKDETPLDSNSWPDFKFYVFLLGKNEHYTLCHSFWYNVFWVFNERANK
jgi:hypothetical protein